MKTAQMKIGPVTFNHMSHNGAELYGYTCPKTQAAYRVLQDGDGWRVDSLRPLNPAWEAVTEEVYLTANAAGKAAIAAAKSYAKEVAARR